MTDAIYRFVVFEVGCLECSGDGSSEPEVIATHEGWEDALASLRGLDLAWTARSDAFIFDTVHGTTLTAIELAKIDAQENAGSKSPDLRREDEK